MNIDLSGCFTALSIHGDTRSISLQNVTPEGLSTAAAMIPPYENVDVLILGLVKDRPYRLADLVTIESITGLTLSLRGPSFLIQGEERAYRVNQGTLHSLVSNAETDKIKSWLPQAKR